MKPLTIGQNIIIGLVTLAVFAVYLGLSGFYAIFALDGYYGTMAGLDFSSDVASSLGVFELGVLAMLYASVGGVFILALIKPEFWPDFHKYFIVSNLFAIFGRLLILLQGYFGTAQIVNMAIEALFIVYGYWRLRQLAAADEPSLFIRDS
ncbi:hypothetical protein KFU94_43700 [Chloroflexi bacterium TSY]|nr:hypothetical protein [Chloroflexi bacterium TSY]